MNAVLSVALVTAFQAGRDHVKKGRHRRFEEARAIKHTSVEIRLDDEGFRAQEPCPECGTQPSDEHASWCLHDEEEDPAPS
ncbi:MAG: hypothetical protein ACSLFB_08005 [Acidimicrobiales bacterium]